MGAAGSRERAYAGKRRAGAMRGGTVLAVLLALSVSSEAIFIILPRIYISKFNFEGIVAGEPINDVYYMQRFRIDTTGEYTLSSLEYTSDNLLTRLFVYDNSFDPTNANETILASDTEGVLEPVQSVTLNLVANQPYAALVTYHPNDTQNYFEASFQLLIQGPPGSEHEFLGEYPTQDNDNGCNFITSTCGACLATSICGYCEIEFGGRCMVGSESGDDDGECAASGGSWHYECCPTSGFNQCLGDQYCEMSFCREFDSLGDQIAGLWMRRPFNKVPADSIE